MKNRLTRNRTWLVSLAIILPIACSALSSMNALAQSRSDSSDSTRGLNLTQLELTPIYEADFSKPLKFIKEQELFENGLRVRKPARDIDWVLEGAAAVRVVNGQLQLLNAGNHLVFWNTRRIPADFLIEFEVIPADSNNGLNIVFFAATARDGGSIFDLDQPMRDGVYKKYYSGDLNAYHASYWATSDKGNPRGTANLRKSHGFHLAAIGKDFIAGEGRGPHRVRVLKLDGHIEVEVNGKIAVNWEDDGQTYGPVLREGFIGLRQMAHTGECIYTQFKVWKVRRKVAYSATF